MALCAFASLLAADIGCSLLPNLSMLDIMSFSGINKLALQATKYHLTVHLHGLVDGHLDEEGARAFKAIMQAARDIAHRMKLYPDKMQAMPAHLLSVQLHATLWTYWHTSASEPCRGIYDQLLAEAAIAMDPASRKHLKEDACYWQTSRVHGEYIVLCDRPDGTIVVSADLQTVCLVLGVEQSLGTAANAQMVDEQWVAQPVGARSFHGMVGTLCSLSLLPWGDRIVCDTALRLRARCSEKVLKKAFHAYCRAVDQQCLQTSLRKETPPVHAVLGADDLYRLQRDYQEDIDALKGMDCNRDNWSCARKQKQEEDSAVIMVSTNRGTTIGNFPAASPSEPCLSDYMALLRELAVQHGVPSAVHIDIPSVAGKLTHLLRGVIAVHYYVPPSAEDVDVMKGLIGADKPRCVYCTVDACEYGKQLFRCSCCHSVHYCSREHQTLAWKHHKKVCKKQRMLL